MKNKISKIVTLYFILLPINAIFKLQFGSIANFIIPVLFIILIIFNIKKIKRTQEFVYIFIFFLLSFLISLYKYNEYLYNYFGLIYLFFCTALPWLLIGVNIDNSEEILKNIKEKIIFLIVNNGLLLIYCLYIGRNMVGNMEISYAILPLCIFSLYYYLKNKNLKYLIMSLTSVGLIVIVGSRGPLVCIAIYILLYLLMNLKEHKKTIIGLILIIILIACNYTNILLNTKSFLDQRGIHSRTLNKLINNEITDDTGRSEIHDVVYQILESNPLGVGIGVERIYINSEFYAGQKEMSSCYPHNLILEIIVQYGYIVGGIIITVLCCWFFLGIKNANEGNKNFLLILLTTEIVRLMISSSYLLSPLFFLCLGLCLRIVYRRKENEENIINSSN